MDGKVAILCTKRCRTTTEIADFFLRNGAEISLFVVETVQRQGYSETERQFQHAHREFSLWLERGKGPGVRNALGRRIRRAWHRVPVPIRHWLLPLQTLVGPHNIVRCGRQLGIPVAKVPQHSSLETRQALESHGISYALLASSQWLIKEPLLSMANMRIINAHPGKLPQHRSLDALPWSVLQNDEIGLTAHLIDKGIDTGPILFFQAVPPKAGDDLDTLRSRVNSRKPEVFLKAIEGLSAGTIVPTPQRKTDGVHHRPMTLDELIEVHRVLKARLPNGTSSEA